MKEQIAQALYYKALARDAREEKDLINALFYINRAIDILDALWQQQGATITSLGADANSESKDLVEALSELYGIKGGILRSAKQLDNAIKSYSTGLIFESHSARKLDNSYNLVQELTTKFIFKIKHETIKEWEMSKQGLFDSFTFAKEELTSQIASRRANDPWAAADMLIIRLLLAAKLSSEIKAMRDDVTIARKQLEALNPKRFVYESLNRTCEILLIATTNVKDRESKLPMYWPKLLLQLRNQLLQNIKSKNLSVNRMLQYQ